MKNNNEERRVEALQSYNILDSKEEEDFDNLVKLAASICETEFAQINFIDSERQWTKAWYGIDIKEIPKEDSFCNHTIKKERDSMVVSNALKDDRFKEREYVINNPKIRFYAGVNIKSNDGFNVGTVCVFGTEAKEITEQQKNALEILAKEVEMRLELRKSQQNLEKQNIYLNNSTDLLMLVESSNFKILEVNKEVEKYFNYEEKDLVGRTLHNLRFDTSDIDKLSLWIKYNSEDTFSEIIKIKSKQSELFLQVDATLKSNLIFITARDITEQQMNLLELKRNFKFQEAISEVALIFDSLDSFDSKMNRTLEILGEVCTVCRAYVFRDFDDGKNCKNEYEWCKKGVTPQIDKLQNLSYELDIPEWKETLLREGEIVCNDIRLLPILIQEILELQNIKSIIVLPLIIDLEFCGFIGFDDTENNRTWSDAEVYLLKTTSVMISNAYKEKFFAHKLKNSEQRLKRFIKQAPVAIAMLDKELFFIETSAKWISDFSENNSNIIGLHYLDTAKNYENTDIWTEIFDSVLSGNIYTSENEKVKKGNEEDIRLSSKITPWYDGSGVVGGIIIFVNDVTKEFKDRIFIEKSLKEKEILLSEVHHRVKNNLAIVSAFLQLEQFSIQNETASNIIDKSIGRIKVMATIHELLYANENFSDINLQQMIDNLCKIIENDFRKHGKINFKLDIEPMNLNINTAIPLALMVNEIIGYSLNDISQSKVKNSFKISLQHRGKDILLSISDNRLQNKVVNPFEAINPLEDEDSFSMTIVKVLTEQIKGNLSFKYDEEARWEIAFKDNVAKGSSSSLAEKDIVKN